MDAVLKKWSRDQLKKLHAAAVKRYEQAIKDESQWRISYLESMKFVDGDQWPDDVLQARKNRPSLVINASRKFAESVVNNERMGTPSILAVPHGDTTNEDARLRNIILSHIEQVSDSKNVFDTALDCQVKGGRGAFRILSRYVNDESFDQDLVLVAIPDPLSVVCDAASTDLLYRDARYLFLTTMIDADEFKHLYPDAKKIDWSNTQLFVNNAFFNQKDKLVRVVEYYFKERSIKHYGLFTDGTVWDIGSDYYKSTMESLHAKTDVKLVKEKIVDSHDVYWVKMSGVEILEGPVKEVTPDIPVIIVPGRVWWNQGKRVYSSLVKDAIDPNRMLNYWVSSATEGVALSKNTDYVSTPEAIAGYENDWTSDIPVGIKRFNSGFEKPAREQPAQLSPALAAMITLSASQIPDVMGISPDFMGMPTNARSRSAIGERAKNSQAGPYVFIDHYMKAIQYAGEIINRRIKYYYDTKRTLTIENEDGQTQSVSINDFDAGNAGVKNDVKKGEFKVRIKTGPSYATLREEAGDQMLQALQWAGPFAGVIIPEIAKSQDWPGADRLSAAIQAQLQAASQASQNNVDSQKQHAILQGHILENTRKAASLSEKGVNINPPQGGAPAPSG